MGTNIWMIVLYVIVTIAITIGIIYLIRKILKNIK